MQSPLLEVNDVIKGHRLGNVAVQALRGISFKVEKGEFVTIFGPSGSGKSTLLHLMGGWTDLRKERFSLTERIF